MPAPPAFVFAAIVDPAVLRRALPGCTAFVSVGRDTYDATFILDVAGLKGTYTGRCGVVDKHPSDSVKVTFDGTAGTIRSSATLRFTADGGATRIACEIEVQVDGTAAIESRLVEAAARRIAADFFVKLAREI